MKKFSQNVYKLTKFRYL